MTKARESTESSSPIITRAVAAGLNGELVENYEFPAWQRSALLAIGALPQNVARFLISHFQALSGLPADCLDGFSLDSLIQTRLEDYHKCQDKYPAIVLGAGLGGATTYLALALQAPFLPQAYVISLNSGSPSGNVEEYLHRTIEPALRIAGRDPRLVTIQHFDPVHDGWLTRYVNHLRFKLIDLPEAYAEFILHHLEPGGSVVYLESGAGWNRYRLGERSFFQVGGWGDISPDEFLKGSPRLTKYAKQAGLSNSSWALDSRKWPLETGPESEWGSEPGLGDAIEQFCKSENFRFVRIHLPEPDDFSRLAYLSAKRMIEKDNKSPAGTVIECFSQFDSISALNGNLLPLWLIFNTHDSARYLKKMSSTFPKGKPVFFSPLATFSLTPDMASWEEWEETIGREFINIGARKNHYPADARALVKWVDPLRKWVHDNPQPVQSRLTAGELYSLAKQFIV